MASLRFYVSRRGSEKVECVATIPSKADFAKFAGGKVSVKTPKGDTTVEVPGFVDLFLASLVIELQNGVRDDLLPLTDKPGKVSNGRSTRYID